MGTDRRAELSDDRHGRIAMLAYSRGMLEQPAFMEVMAALGRDGALSLDEVWIASGRLALSQLEALLLALDAADNRVDGNGGANEATSGRDSVHVNDELPESYGPSTAVQVPIAHFDSSQAPPPMDIELEPLTSYATDRYVRLRTLGSGGMGDVFECMDHRLGRRVAVKMLRREHESDALAVAMLDREARVTGSLEHPNIIPVYDAGREAGTKPFYAMRLLPQTSLDEVLKRLRARDTEARREYTLGRLLRLFFQVCQAVEYAHSRGVIHCDLKPGNILLGSFGEVLVADWGLAYSQKDASTYRGGTPGYMAPEQLEPSPRGIDARTDVFALGAILYELVSHHPAFPDALDSIAYAGIGADRNTNRELSPKSTPLRIPPAPSAIAPERAIASELDSICLRDSS
jgi:eukaryotic-like serine/threonine-protein kinase